MSDVARGALGLDEPTVGTMSALAFYRPFEAGETAMKKNLISALVLAALSCFSTACLTSSSPEDAANDASANELGSSMTDKTDNEDLAQAKPQPADSPVLAPSELPFGASYEQWAAAYWQWVMSIPAEKNPILDGPCEQMQSGNVFFLAGNTGGGHLRSCTIAAYTPIFVPLLSGLGRSCPEIAPSAKVCNAVTSEDSIRSQASAIVDSANALLHLEIDGQPISIGSEYRIQTKVFADKSPENPEERLFASCSGPIEANRCGIEEGSSRDVVADGYFIMLAGLTPGTHEIIMAANVSPDSSEPPYEVVYRLDVTR